MELSVDERPRKKKKGIQLQQACCLFKYIHLYYKQVEKLLKDTFQTLVKYVALLIFYGITIWDSFELVTLEEVSKVLCGMNSALYSVN